MSFPPNSMSYSQGFGASPNLVAFPHIDVRAPTASDVLYPIGQRWVDTVNDSEWVLTSQSSSSGSLQSNWSQGGNPEATTSEFGIVQLATLAELQGGSAPAGAYVPTSNDVATVIQALVVGVVPPATETQQGIAEIATQVETDAGTLDDKIVTPLKLANFVASGGFPGVFTDLTATGTVSFTGATGGITMTSATASSFGTTGAGIDLTLSSAAGRVVVNGEEAAADAVRILSAAGGLDVDVALQMNLVSSQNAADAIVVNASAGGIDITAAGAAGEDIDIVNTSGSINLTAGESIASSMVFTNNGMDIVTSGAAGRDIDITNTGGSINVTATENNAGAIIIQANGGTSERVTLLASQGTAGDSINLESTAGGITLSAALATADAINLAASAGGVDIDGALQVNIASSQNAVDAIRIVASAGGIDIDAVGAATEDINITNTGGSVVIVATESVADAIRMNASGAAGGFDIDAGSNGFIVDTTGAISLDSAAASNFTVTGAFALDVGSSLGKVTLSSGQSAADSVVITSLIGGIDILAAGAAAGEDIDIIATGSSVNIQATESDINAITINASGVAGGINVDSGTSGVIVDTTGAISLDSAAASNFTVTGAFDLSLISSLGSVNVTAGEDAADAIVLSAGAGGIDILATGAAGQDIDIVNTGGSVNITATESAADSLVLTSTAGGIQILASGAAAGEDILVTATGSSITLTSTENVTDAINFTASGAASRINLTAGTGSINLASGLIVAKKDLVFADSPYTVLGTDYFLSVDTSGGAITVTLPNAATLAGRTYVIRDTGGAAAATNITVATAGGNLVGGGASAATKTISAAYAGATVYSNGTTWNYCYVA